MENVILAKAQTSCKTTINNNGCLKAKGNATDLLKPNTKNEHAVMSNIRNSSGKSVLIPESNVYSIESGMDNSNTQNNLMGWDTKLLMNAKAIKTMTGKKEST